MGPYSTVQNDNALINTFNVYGMRILHKVGKKLW